MKKPKIELIKISKEKMQELQKTLAMKQGPFSRMKHNTIKRYAGGICCLCGEIPTKKVTLDIEDAQIIEKYCEQCFEKRKNGFK